MNPHLSVDIEFIGRLKPYLSRFKQVSEKVYNFRCPLCGDSTHNKYRARGYLLQDDKMEWRAYCHNCGENVGFKEFLKVIDTSLYQDYVAAILKDKPKRVQIPEKVEAKSFETSLLERHIIPVVSLPEEHPAKVYLKGRLVPESSMKFVFWTDEWKELSQESFFEGKYNSDIMFEKGIVFPLYNREKKLTGFQLRSIEAETKTNRFQTMIAPNQEAFFGVERLREESAIYVVEGCTDSLFLPNCVAVLNSRLSRFPFPGATYFQDQEPRNKAICDQLEASISKGFKVVLLPLKYSGMDVNDIFKELKSQVKLLELFKKYTFQGLRAKIEFGNWKRA